MMSVIKMMIMIIDAKSGKIVQLVLYCKEGDSSNCGDKRLHGEFINVMDKKRDF